MGWVFTHGERIEIIRSRDTDNVPSACSSCASMPMMCF